jgi:hypothetical protein
MGCPIIMGDLTMLILHSDGSKVTQVHEWGEVMMAFTTKARDW